MRIHLIGATVLGLASAGFAMSPAAFAATNGVGNNTAGMNYNNGSQAYGKQNTRTQSQPNGQQALNQQRNEGWVGSSGNGSAMNNGVQSTQGSQQATNRRNEGWVGSSGNGSAANNGVQSNEQGQNRNTGWTGSSGNGSAQNAGVQPHGEDPAGAEPQQRLDRFQWQRIVAKHRSERAQELGDRQHLQVRSPMPCGQESS